MLSPTKNPIDPRQLPLDQRLAGVLVLSGYLPGASQFTITKGLESTPVLHCHGSSDPVVIPDWALKTRDHVTEKGKPCTLVKSTVKIGRSQIHDHFVE